MLPSRAYCIHYPNLECHRLLTLESVGDAHVLSDRGDGGVNICAGGGEHLELHVFLDSDLHIQLGQVLLGGEMRSDLVGLESRVGRVTLDCKTDAQILVIVGGIERGLRWLNRGTSHEKIEASWDCCLLCGLSRSWSAAENIKQVV